MLLKHQLLEDMKSAMKSGNKQDLEVIRFLMAKIKNVEIDQGELNDTQIQQLIGKQIKEMKESLADYEKAGRSDLAESDTAKIAILDRYMPAPLTEAELDSLIEKTIAENPGAPFGQVIGKVNQQAAGRVDGGIVAQKVKKKLS